jgi:hypothetical protein
VHIRLDRKPANRQCALDLQTLLELAQRDIGGIVQLPGRALVLLLGLQQTPPQPQALPSSPLLISGYIVQRNEMPP